MDDVASRLDAFSQRLVKAQGSEIPSMAGSLPEIAWTYKQHFIPMLLIALGIELFAPFALAWMAVYGMDGRTSRKGERFARPLQVDDALPAVAPMTADLAPPTPEKPVRKPKGPPRA
jgi:hypothetical protein